MFASPFFGGLGTFYPTLKCISKKRVFPPKFTVALGTRRARERFVQQ